MATKRFTFISDPGHGWLKVSRADLIAAGVDLLISRYSYQRGDTVWLEEDCDAGIFLTALTNAGKEFKIAEKHGNRQSTIRSLERYDPMHCHNVY